MKNSNQIIDLRNRIVILEEQQAGSLINLKEQFYITAESLKPINLIKHLFKDLISAPSIKHTIFKSILGLTSGYLTKKMWVGSSHNPVKKVIGTVLEFVVANFVTNRADTPSK